jgi:hypothetical protein
MIAFFVSIKTGRSKGQITAHTVTAYLRFQISRVDLQKLDLFYHVSECRLLIKFEKYTEKILLLPEKTIQDLAICSYRWISCRAWVEKVIRSHFHPQSLTYKTADNY